jgi:hypothetical protein
MYTVSYPLQKSQNTVSTLSAYPLGFAIRYGDK